MYEYDFSCTLFFFIVSNMKNNPLNPLPIKGFLTIAIFDAIQVYGKKIFE